VTELKECWKALAIACSANRKRYDSIRYEEFDVDSKTEYSALFRARGRKRHF